MTGIDANQSFHPRGTGVIELGADMLPLCTRMRSVTISCETGGLQPRTEVILMPLPVKRPAGRAVFTGEQTQTCRAVFRRNTLQGNHAAGTVAVKCRYRSAQNLHGI